MSPRNNNDDPKSIRGNLDRMPKLPPDATRPAKGHLRSLMSRITGGGSDSDSDTGGGSPDADVSSIKTLASGNPLFAALSVSKEIESKIPLLARFAPKTAANLQLLLRTGITDELMNGGQPPQAPQFTPGAPQSVTPPQTGIQASQTGAPNPMLSAASPPAPGMPFGG